MKQFITFIILGIITIKFVGFLLSSLSWVFSGVFWVLLILFVFNHFSRKKTQKPPNRYSNMIKNFRDITFKSKQSPEKQILRLGDSFNRNSFSLKDVIVNTNLELDEAKKTLDKLEKRELVKLVVTKDGKIQYQVI